MSTELTVNEKDRFAVLLVKAVDGELDKAEREEFERFVQTYPSCRDEWQAHKQLKEVTETMKFKSPPPEVWDGYWLGIYNRLERGFGWILLSLGAIILFVYGAFMAVESLIADQGIGSVVKTGIVLAMTGGIVLIVSVVREKLFTHKSDPYKEIQR